METFEYRILSELWGKWGVDDNRLEDILNKEGSGGWEVVGFSTRVDDEYPVIDRVMLRRRRNG